MTNMWLITVPGEGDELETFFQFTSTGAVLAAIRKLQRIGRVKVRRVKTRENQDD
jgi:hypothetical protein